MLRVAVDNTGHTYNVDPSLKSYGPDVETTTRQRCDGGGVLWRAKDASKYYISRWNSLGNNLRVYKVEASKRRQPALIPG